MSIKSIRVKIWRDADSLYFPGGHNIDLSCTHIQEGVWGVNMNGEIIPAQTSTVPAGETGTDYQKQSLMVPAGRVYSSPTHFSDSSFKVVVKVKDMTNLNTYYVDQDSYNAAIDNCNGCCTPGTCGNVEYTSVTPDIFSATAEWAAVEGAVGYEWIVLLSSDSGTVAPTSGWASTTDTTATQDSLEPVTDYYFAVRSVCPGNVKGAWVYYQFRTLSD